MYVPVGFPGLAKKTIFVLFVTFFKILSTLTTQLISFAIFTLAPAVIEAIR